MFIQTTDAKIFAISFGSTTAPAIVAIGGWIGSWELWLEPFSILSQTWHTIAYDHRGAGITVAPLESITLEQMVDDVFSVLDAYQIERCVLAAESAGALTALMAALKKPDRIAGLVIVDGNYFQAKSVEKSSFLTGLQTNFDATLNYFIKACVPESDSEHIKGWGLKILQRASQDAAIALYNAVYGVDLRHEFARVMQPTLILHGDKDVIVPIESAMWLAKTLPQSKLVILEGAGHVPTVTCPEVVAREITSFFEQQ